MPPDHTSERTYSVRVKTADEHPVVAEKQRRGEIIVGSGMASTNAEDIAVFLWGKDTSLYIISIDDIEYDCATTGDMEEKVRGIIDFHEAFYAS